MTILLPPGCRATAERQDGMITRRQVGAGGRTAVSVETLLRTGRWQAVHRGVYATFTGPLSREATLWAAVLRAGPDAMLSHQSAAEVSGLRDRRPGGAGGRGR